MTYDARFIDPWVGSERGGVTTNARLITVSGGGDVVTRYINRCWHYSNSEFVRWTTEIDPDPTGISYPGPGTFGVDTSSPAVVESIEE